MHLKLKYPSLPEIEIVSSVEECARLLHLLGDGQGRGDGKKPDSGGPAPHVPEDSARQDSQKQEKKPVDTVKPPDPRPDQEQPRQIVPAGTRPYRGKPNRRKLVLETMRHLKENGNPTPGLEEIKTTFAALYPDEDIRHLDQVVRDLANKTGLVERHQWGTFKLSD